MNEEQLDAGAQQLVALIHAVPTDTDLFLRLNRLILDLGRPVSVEELAAAPTLGVCGARRIGDDCLSRK